MREDLGPLQVPTEKQQRELVEAAMDMREVDGNLPSELDTKVDDPVRRRWEMRRESRRFMGEIEMTEEEFKSYPPELRRLYQQWKFQVYYERLIEKGEVAHLVKAVVVPDIVGPSEAQSEEVRRTLAARKDLAQKYGINRENIEQILAEKEKAEKFIQESRDKGTYLEEDQYKRFGVYVMNERQYWEAATAFSEQVRQKYEAVGAEGNEEAQLRLKKEFGQISLDGALDVETADRRARSMMVSVLEKAPEEFLKGKAREDVIKDVLAQRQEGRSGVDVKERLLAVEEVVGHEAVERFVNDELAEFMNKRREELEALGLSFDDDAERVYRKIGLTKETVEGQERWVVAEDSPVRALLLHRANKEALSGSLGVDLAALVEGKAGITPDVYEKIQLLFIAEAAEEIAGSQIGELGACALGEGAYEQAKQGKDYARMRVLAQWLGSRGKQVEAKWNSVGGSLSETAMKFRDLLGNKEMWKKAAKILGISVVAIIVALLFSTMLVGGAVTSGVKG